MEWLNYHHLLYFWTVARTGSIANASKDLLLAPPTISAQVSRLEHTVGEKLFARSGRRLVLTEAGRVVFLKTDGDIRAVLKTILSFAGVLLAGRLSRQGEVAPGARGEFHPGSDVSLARLTRLKGGSSEIKRRHSLSEIKCAVDGW